MDYISTRDAAAEWGIGERVVQRYCTRGRIPGAVKFSGVWQIPRGSSKPADPRKGTENPEEPPFVQCGLISEAHPMISGMADTVIQTIHDPAEKLQLLGEFAYLRGDFRESRKLLLKIDDIRFDMHRFSILAADAVSMGDYELLTRIEEYMLELISRYPQLDDRESPAWMHYYAISIALSLHERCPRWLKTGDFRSFPKSMHKFASYMHMKYLFNTLQYQKLTGFARGILLSIDKETYKYTLTDIYIYILAAMGFLAADDGETARQLLETAIALALPDGFITPFAEYKPYLFGLDDDIIKREYPEQYDLAAEQWEVATRNWFIIHNEYVKSNVAAVLSIKEYQIAILLAAGNTYKDIALKQRLSPEQVRKIVNSIYSKLMIRNKSQLRNYLLMDQNK